MINLTEEDKIKIFQVRDYKELNLSCGNFYVKRAGVEVKAFGELLGKRLADIIGIKCPNIYVVVIGDEYYVISENLRNQGFKTAIQLGITERKNYKLDSCSLIDAGCYVDVLPSSLETMIGLVKMYIYDVLFYHEDRNLGNWGLCPKDNKLEIAIIDNENILNPYNTEVFQKFHATPEFRGLNIYQDFLLFLKEHDIKYLKLFKYFFDLLNPNYFNSIVADLDRTNIFSSQIKKQFQETYQKHYEELKIIYEQEFLGRSSKNAR